MRVVKGLLCLSLAKGVIGITEAALLWWFDGVLDFLDTSKV
jgi:hypothetical protein